MSNTTQPAARYCAKCGKNTSLLACPIDGAPTFARDGNSAGALRYEPGTVINGKYKIGRRLGRGGFGAVYAAENMTTSHQVAIKVLAVDPDDADDSMIQRFLQEAQVTARLNHPNTIRVYDFGQTEEGALFMVMEMLKGPTLEQVLKDHDRADTAMSERETLTLAIAVLRSLAEAHDAHLVHRDLKPLNIMLHDSGDDERVVKVLDFGIARKQDSQLTGTGKALGTPAYMSPEQCKGGKLDGRSDLYALGTIMFRCVAGRLPFQKDNQLALLQAQINEPSPNVRKFTGDKLSDGFVAALERVLEKDPRARFENARAMRQELEAVLGGAWAGTPMHAMDVLEEEPDATGRFVVEPTRFVDSNDAGRAKSAPMAAVATRSKSASMNAVAARAKSAPMNAVAARAKSAPMNAVAQSRGPSGTRFMAAEASRIVEEQPEVGVNEVAEADAEEVDFSGEMQAQVSNRGRWLAMAAGAGIVCVVAAIWFMWRARAPADEPVVAPPAAVVAPPPAAVEAAPQPADGRVGAGLRARPESAQPILEKVPEIKASVPAAVAAPAPEAVAPVAAPHAAAAPHHSPTKMPAVKKPPAAKGKANAVPD